MSTAQAASDGSKFAGSIPQLYEEYLVPLLFLPYARDLCRRVVSCQPESVLELAAGTGAVTRELAAGLAPGTSIVATDLNQAMLDVAARAGTARPVEWRQADALALPFPDRSFDVVVCQFGVMFFPDKAAAYTEARRVLRPGGHFIFNSWDRIETSEMMWTACGAVDALFPDDPPRFMQRGPHGYADKALIAADLERAGLPGHQIETVALRSRADTPRSPAIGFCQGSPLRLDLEARGGAAALAAATDAAEAAIRQRFGSGPIEGGMQAQVAVARV